MEENNMKKLLAILCVLAMLSMLCVPAFAVEGVDTLSIVGTGLPGIAEWSTDDAAGVMEQTEDGIFVKELALTAGSVIKFKFAVNKTWDVNYGGATVVADEAVALAANGGDISLAVDKDTTLKFTVDLNATTLLVEGEGITDVPEAPVEPAGDLTKMSMMGEGLPTLNWDPGNPANEMKKEGNVFVKELGVTAGTSIKFKFAGNGAWDSGYNFGSGVVEVGKAVEMANGNDSTDMTYTATENCTLKFTVDPSAVADGGAATVMLEILPPAAPPEIEGDSITVSVDPFNDWTQVIVYVWGDEGEYAAWPGIQMSDADSDGWYEVQVPAGYPNMIVSNGAGYQTTDLEVDGTVDIWVTMGSDEAGKVTVTTDYINPGPALDITTPVPVPDPLDTLAMLGEGCDGLNWDPADETMKMTRSGDVFTKELTVTAGTTIKLKFAGNGAWDAGYNFGSATIELGKAAEMVNGGDSQDMPFTATEDCTLKITVDASKLAEGGAATVLVEKVAGGATTKPGDDATEPTTDPTTAPTEATQPTDNKPAEKKDNTATILIVVIVVVVVGAVAACAVILKKK